MRRIRVDVASPSLTGLPSAAFEIINGAVNVTSLTPSPNAEQVTLNWINPAGCFNEIMIVVKEGSAIDEMPTGDGLAYTADVNFSGSGSAFNGGKVVYKGTQIGIIITGLQTAKEYYIKAFTRNGSYWSSGIQINIKTRFIPMPGEILINQVSPEFGEASDEYIELVDTTGKTFDLSELNISYHAASGNTGTVGKRLSGMLQPYSYWLLSNNEVVNIGKTSIARDGDFTGRYAASAGQLALVRLLDNVVIDGFGYGKIDGPTYTEGQSAPASLPKGGYRRKDEGSDTNNNSVDFERVANTEIDLRNSKSRLVRNAAIIPGGNYWRIYVTGDASISGDVTVEDKVVLQKGLLQLSSNKLTIAKTEGGNAISYLQTNASGAVIIQKLSEAEVIIPIGNKTYNPVTISNGGDADWQVHVADDILYAPVPFNSKKAVLRTWQVKPLSTITSGANIQLQYQKNDMQAGAEFNDADVQVWNFTTQWQMAGQPQKQVETNDFKTIMLKDWKQAGTFVIANAAAEMSSLAVLPIKFINVKAIELPHAIQIEFTNAAETDVAHYIVERSANGVDFVPVATINPMHNNGNAVTYQWIDKTRPAGNNFYRVKGVELDGKVMYSIVLKITVDRNLKALNIFPNPMLGRQATWEASLPQSSFVLRITASNGQQVMVKNFKHTGGNISQVIELPAGLRPGQYLLQIISSNFLRQQMFVVL